MSRALLLVLDRLMEQEELARNVYIAAKQAEANFEKQLAALDQYRSVYTKELNNRGMSSQLSTLSFGQYTAFINRLDSISKEQMLGLQKVKAETKNKFEQYKALEAKRKGIEMLLEKKKIAKAKQQDMQEQKLSDDLVTNRFFQKQ